MISLKNPLSIAPRHLTVFLIISFLSIPAVSSVTDVHMVESFIPAADEPLSVILMIGDGMGFNHVELARLVEVGEGGSLNMQNSDWNASVTTYAADEPVTDSAAAATAMATGNKTNYGYVSVSPTLVPLETILEFAQSLNKSTGVVATSRITHATPACFMTHVVNRNDETEIARQIVDEADVDVILGGGAGYFTGSQITSMASDGYSIVYNRTELLSVSTGKVLGLFADSHMDYEYNRNYAEQPSIAEMTNKSIELLSQDTDGFFLMVEGSRIDHAAHDGDRVPNALDTIAFDKAVEVALDYVTSHDNTILIVTADHETGGMLISSYDLSSELPGGLSTEVERRSHRIDRALNVTVEWTVTYHTDWLVPLFAVGDAFENMTKDITIDNTHIYYLMKDFFLGNPLNQTELPPPPTIPTTSTSPTTPTSSSPTNPTSPSGNPFDSSILLVVSIGAVVLVLVAIILIKRR